MSVILLLLACTPKPPEAGDIWESPNFGNFRWIPPGSFMMGSPESEERRFSNESQHSVTLTFGFWLMDHELTEGEWKAVTGGVLPDSRECGDDCPIVHVTWDEIQEFVADANEEGSVFRLPTEAEWEYAARGGEEYVWAGSDIPEDVGWYYENSDERLHLGCLKQRNGYGLCDMCGNAWEWVADYFDLYPPGDAVDPTGPAGPTDGDIRVYRGGAWDYGAVWARVAARGYWEPFRSDSDLGFRLAISGF